MIPDIGIANGIMSAVLNFAKAMPEDIKFDIVYFFEKQPSRQEEIEALGGRVYKIDKPSPKDLLSSKLNSFFNEHKGEWSALHIHQPHFAGFIAPSAKKAGICKICVHCHSSVFSLKGNSKRNQLLNLYEKYFISDKFACSALAGKFWYGNKPFTVINNAIDCAKYSFNEELRSAVRISLNADNRFIVGHIGRTDIPQKNHRFLIEVFSEVVKRKRDSILLLIGAVETDELTELCRQLDISDKVRFLGMRNDVSDLLQACDVFLFPSTREGLPVSVIEAQASGLPVVMSDSVTDECCVTDLVTTMPLSSPASSWADAVCSADSNVRRNTYDELCRAGWDLTAVTKQLSEYYMN